MKAIPAENVREGDLVLVSTPLNPPIDGLGLVEVFAVMRIDEIESQPDWLRFWFQNRKTTDIKKSTVLVTLI